MEFNVGELSARLRRSLAIRGRIPLTVDESVVPVVRVLDAEQALYSDYDHCMGGGLQPAVVGQRSALAVITAPQFFPSIAPVVPVIKRIILSAPGVTTNYEIRMGNRIGGNLEQGFVTNKGLTAAGTVPVSAATVVQSALTFGPTNVLGEITVNLTPVVLELDVPLLGHEDFFGIFTQLTNVEAKGWIEWIEIPTLVR